MTYVVQSLKVLDKEAVNAFCRRNSRYCSIYHEFIFLAGREDDFSFAVTERDRIVALCPFIRESKVLDGETYALGAFLGLSLPGPIIAEEIDSEKVLKTIGGHIFASIDDIVREKAIAKVTYNLTNYASNDKRSSLLYGEMKRNHYLDASLQMMQINLNQESDLIMKNFSKGHRAAIKRYLDHQVVIENRQNTPLNAEAFHTKLEAFYSQDLMNLLFLLYEHGFLEFGHFIENGQTTAFSIFLKHGHVLHYYAAKRLTETELPVHHIILWKAILHYQAEAFKILDFGVVTGGPYLNYLPTEKQQMIAHFKKGFGGGLLPFICGEKYYNRDFFRKEYGKRVQDFMERFIDA